MDQSIRFLKLSEWPQMIAEQCNKSVWLYILPALGLFFHYSLHLIVLHQCHCITVYTMTIRAFLFYSTFTSLIFFALLCQLAASGHHIEKALTSRLWILGYGGQWRILPMDPAERRLHRRLQKSSIVWLWCNQSSDGPFEWCSHLTGTQLMSYFAWYTPSGYCDTPF